MRKAREICTARDCIIITCGRHYKHIPKHLDLGMQWIDFVKEGCDMYRSKDRWSDLFIDHEREEDDLL